MKRGWFLVLALSIGLNAGLLYSALSAPPRDSSPTPQASPPFLEGADPGPVGAPGSPGSPASEVPLEAMRVRLDHMTRSLGLDERQRMDMQHVLDETMPRIIAAREEVRQARRAVQTEYGADRLEPGRVHRAVRTMNTAQARLDSLVAETMLREIAVLGPEQLRRYRACLPWERCHGPQYQPAEGRGPHGRSGPGLRRQAVTP